MHASAQTQHFATHKQTPLSVCSFPHFIQHISLLTQTVELSTVELSKVLQFTKTNAPKLTKLILFGAFYS